jgi:hypothetical protein
LTIAEPAAAEVIGVEEGTLEIYEGASSRLGGNGEEITFQFVGRCDQPATVEIGRGIAYRIASICGGVRWNGWDRIRPLWMFEERYRDHGDFGTGTKGLPLTVSVSDEPPNYERTLAVRIHFGGQLIRRFLYVYRATHPPKRIYEGSDAFVNVCINRGLEIRSIGGRLYCETAGREVGELQISKRP